MAYNEVLAGRLRDLFEAREGISEKNMFGGMAFFIHGKMFCGIIKDDLVVKIDPVESEYLLKKPGVRPMDFTGRPMKGFLYVAEEGIESDEELKRWVEKALTFVSESSRK